MADRISHPHNITAILLIAFWLCSLDQVQRNLRAYLLATPLMTAYWIFTCADHHKLPTNIEWFADGLVWYHFFSVVFFLPGTPLKVNRRFYEQQRY